VVAVNRPCAEARPLILEPVRESNAFNALDNPQAVQNFI
jgi:hypothetical protein